jgi:hypothetical protein
MANNLIDFLYMKTIKKNCLICDSEFFPLKAEVNRGRGKVCSRECRYKHQANVMRDREKSAETCSKLSKSLTGRKRTKLHAKNISKGLKGKFLMENNPNWKGGEYESQGRRFVRIPNHPFPYQNGYILHARHVVEAVVGRFLTPSEQVHHINFVKNDDRPENLYIFSSAAEHTKYHNLLKGGEVSMIIESNLSSFK